MPTVDSSDSHDNNLVHHTVVVSPHGSKLVELQELASAIAVGGIRVSYDGPEDGILVNGNLEDLSKGYSATIPFLPTTFPADPRASVSFAELGLMSGAADPMMKFPAGTAFTPYSIVRNISDQPVSIALSLYWMEGGAAKAAQLQRLTIPPHRTRDLDAPSFLAMSGLKNFNGSVSLILDVQGNPHSLLMTGGSVDQTDTYVFESLPSPAKESVGKSVSRWTIDKGDDTMVTLWNPADEAQDLVFTMHFLGGHYRYPIHLGPRATHMFNVSEIVQNQVSDWDGNVIPAGVRESSAEITGPLRAAQHILVAVTASSYNVQKATCSWFCIPCSGVEDTWTDGQPFSIPVGGQAQLSYIQEWDFGDLDCTKCTDVVWISNHTNIATVSAALVTGVAAGSVQISVSAPEEPVPGETCGDPPDPCDQPLQNVNPPTANGDVGPDHLSVISDTEQYPAQCPTTGVYIRQMKFQVADALGNSITNNPSVVESFSNESQNSCGTEIPHPNPAN